MIEAYSDRVMLRRRGGLTEKDSRKIAPLLIKIAIDSNGLQYPIQYTMAFTKVKRKHAEDIYGDKLVNKSHKRVRSDHVPLSSINHEAAAQLRDSNTSTVDEVANSSTKHIPKQLTDSDIRNIPGKKETLSTEVNPEAELTSRPNQSIVADAPDSSADEAPSLSLKRVKTESTSTPKVLPVKKATKSKQASGKASDSFTDKVPIVKPSKIGTSKEVSPKVSSSQSSSLDEGNGPTAEPTDVGIDATSEAALLAPSNPPSEEALGEQEGSQNGGENDEEEVEDYDDDEGNDESEPGSGSSSDSSIESASDATGDSDGEPHPDKKKKETLKADNPSAFASSMAGILGYKLTRTQRANPILARSADAKEADETLLDMKLEKKAKAEMRKEKFKKGGDPKKRSKEVHGDGAQDLVRNVLGIDEPLEPQQVFAYQQHEKELRKMAQKGVVKMFNAFTSVRERAMEAQRLGGSRAKKEEKATEMSKEGWLEYVGQGGKGKV